MHAFGLWEETRMSKKNKRLLKNSQYYLQFQIFLPYLLSVAFKHVKNFTFYLLTLLINWNKPIRKE